MKKKSIFLTITVFLIFFITFPIASAQMKFSGTAIENGHKYAICNYAVSWNDALEFCKEQGGYLVTITSEREQKVIEQLLKDYGKKEAYWIGAKKDNTWQWLTGEKFEFTHWAEGEPNSKEPVMVGQIFFTKRENGDLFAWDDTWANGDIGQGIQSQGFICEWDNSAVGVVLEKNKHKVIDQNMFMDNEFYENYFCMLCILTQQKYRMIENAISYSFDSLFGVVNQQSKSLKNFLLKKEKVNIYQSNYESLNNVFDDKINNKKKESKNIKDKDTVIFSGEIDYNGHKYAICNIDTTWEKAEKICELVDGYLVSITSAEEQKAIEELVFLYSEKEEYWIGAYKKKTWGWKNGEPFKYTNWAKGEPDSEEDVMVAHMYSPLKKGKQAYFWDDTRSPGDSKGAEKNHGFICEWDESDVSIKKDVYSKNAAIRQIIKGL